MTDTVWLLPVLPLCGAAILLLGGRRTDAWGHLLGCAAALASFALGVVLYLDMLVALGRRAHDPPDPVPLGARRPVAGGLRPATRPVVHVFRAADHRRRIADPHLLGRIHEGGSRPSSVFRVPQPVPRGDAAAGARRQLPRPVPGLGGRGPGVVPADRILVLQADGGDRGQEGVRRQPRRRHGPGDRDDDHVRDLRRGVVRRRLRRRRRDERGHAHRDRADAAARRLRQVRAGAAAVVARRRDGGPDPGVGADPRGDDGHRGRVPDRAVEPGLRPGTDRATGGGAGRRGDAAVRCRDRLREGRHQEGACRIDDEPDRLHGACGGPGPGRLRVRDHAPAHPRLLQGRAVPRRRVGDARDERRGEHAPLRRIAHGHADHVRHVRNRVPRDHRHPAVRGVLLQGQDHRGGVRGQRDPRPGCPARRRNHRVLHDAGDADDVLRRAQVGPGRAKRREM